jgi:hypothetical protein
VDWVEHFQRSLFYLHHLPADIQIVDNYILPARPPMMNLLGAFFMGVVTDRFETYQAVFTFLNLLAFLPCCLMLGALVKNRKACYLPLTVLFALNPMMMENAWYPWTKLLTVFFVLFGLWLYLAGLRKNDSLRIVSAFLCLAAGLLVHYSAGPYVVFVAGHYLLRVFARRPNRIRELAGIGVCSGLLLASWFGWSMKVFGVHNTFESNTSVTASQKYEGSAGGKIAGNLVASLIPAVLRQPEALNIFNQPNRWGKLRDHAFVFYQTNLIFAMGSIGGPLVLWLLYRALRKTRSRPSERAFWLAFIPVIIALGIVVVGESDQLGSAHLTLVPLVALGITLLAAYFPWSRTVALFVIAGCAADFSLGIFLQERVQNLENSPERTVFTGISVHADGIEAGVPGPDSLTVNAWANWYWKNREALFDQWSGQLAKGPQAPWTRNALDQMHSNVVANSRNFGGWYGRHGGRITFLGDHLAGPSFAGLDAPSCLFLLLFSGMIGALWKQWLHFRIGDLPQPLPVRSSPARKRTTAS